MKILVDCGIGLQHHRFFLELSDDFTTQEVADEVEMEVHERVSISWEKVTTDDEVAVSS
jgi:hypothetical protein